MKKIHTIRILLFLGVFSGLSITAFAQKSKSIKNDKTYKTLAAKRVQLPNQWKLTPAGTSLPLGDLPLNAVVSSSKKLMAVTNNGVDKHYIQLFNTEGGIKEVSKIDIDKAWYGLAFSSDEKRLYASGGHDNTIVIFNINNQILKRDTVIKLGEPWAKNKIGSSMLSCSS